MLADYVETNILIYAMFSQEEEAKKRIREMLPNERRALQKALTLACDWVDEVDEAEEINSETKRD